MAASIKNGGSRFANPPYVLASNAPVDEVHKRAILTGAGTTGRTPPRHSQSHKVREIYVVRRIKNGSTEPYSLFNVV